jgi:hypothetical protein
MPAKVPVRVPAALGEPARGGIGTSKAEASRSLELVNGVTAADDPPKPEKAGLTVPTRKTSSGKATLTKK